MKDELDLDFLFNKISGEVMRENRKKKNYTLQQVADKLQTTRQAIFRYEKAEVRIKHSTFRKYCYAIDEEPSTVWEEISLKYMQYVALNKNKIDEEEEL